LSCSNRHGPGKIRKLKELAVRGRDARGFVLYSAGLSVSVADNSLVLALGNDCYITNVISSVAVIGNKILIF